MILEEKYRSGFIIYPTLPRADRGTTLEFKFCQSCGRLFVRETRLERVHRHTADCFDERYTSFGRGWHQLVCRVREGSIDETGVPQNVGKKYCDRCSHVPEFIPKPPQPSELEEAIKDQKLRYRRQGADHSNRPTSYRTKVFGSPKTNWRQLVVSVEGELRKRERMTSREIGAFCHYAGSGSAAIQSLERNGLSLEVVGEDIVTLDRGRTRVRVYSLRKPQ